MWEPRRLTTLWALTAYFRYIFTYYTYVSKYEYCSQNEQESLFLLFTQGPVEIEI
jgi:hypothetical protein